MSSKSASLEELVRANKAQFDRIFSTQMGTPDAQTGDTAEPSETPASVAEDGQAPLDSSIRKILTERYGDGWSHEIVEHSIDGDEVRVVCRLEADGLTSTQHGNARSSGNVGIALQRGLVTRERLAQPLGPARWRGRWGWGRRCRRHGCKRVTPPWRRRPAGPPGRP